MEQLSRSLSTVESVHQAKERVEGEVTSTQAILEVRACVRACVCVCVCGCVDEGAWVAHPKCNPSLSTS